MSFLMDFSVWI